MDMQYFSSHGDIRLDNMWVYRQCENPNNPSLIDQDLSNIYIKLNAPSNNMKKLKDK